MSRWTATHLRKGEDDVYVTLVDREEVEFKVLGLWSASRFMGGAMLTTIVQGMIHMMLHNKEEYDL